MKIISIILTNAIFIVLYLSLTYFSKQELETSKHIAFIAIHASFLNTIEGATDRELEHVDEIIQRFVNGQFPGKKFSSFFAEYNQSLFFFANNLNLNKNTLYKEMLRVYLPEKYGYFQIGTSYFLENEKLYIIFSTKLTNTQILGFALLANDVNGKNKFYFIMVAVFFIMFLVLNIILIKFRRRK